MEPVNKDERYFSVKIISSLPLAEQLHEANALICTEAADDESAFLEKSETRNGHIVLLYRLWRREVGKSRSKESPE
jgi:kynurenine formamidase